MLIIMIVKLPELGKEHVAHTLEWVFYVALPNFCFSKSLQDLHTKYTYSTTCSQIDEIIDRTTFCAGVRSKNMTNPCCPGELQDIISSTDL